MSLTDQAIYKIMTETDWDTFIACGTTDGSALDRADGFIHFSTRTQLQGTLDKHYIGAGTIILAEIPLAALDGQDLRWEAARGGDLFPHLYGPLSRRDLAQDWTLKPQADGRYALPDF